MRKRKSPWGGAIRALLMPGVVLAAVLCFATALTSLEDGQSAEQLHQLEDALRRGCVACYAAEGIYPPDLDYLTEHYGVQVDGERYTVYYTIFGSNLMPDITVLENRP